jgi:hypothetical protein
MPETARAATELVGGGIVLEPGRIVRIPGYLRRRQLRMSKRCRQNRKMCRIPVILVYLLGFAPLARFKRPPKEIGCRHLDHIKRVKDFARITQFSGFRLSLAKQRAAIFGALSAVASSLNRAGLFGSGRPPSNSEGPSRQSHSRGTQPHTFQGQVGLHPRMS